MIYIKDFFLHLFFILFPILLYHSITFYRNEIINESMQKMYLFISCSISSIMCMLFPIFVHAGVNFDLRGIPIIIAILYGGYLYGFFTIVVLLLFRLLIGGYDGIISTFIATPLYTILPAFLYPYWADFNKKIKFVASFFIISIKFLALYFVIFFGHSFLQFQYNHLFEDFRYAILLGVFSFITIVLAIFLLEYFLDIAAIQRQVQKTKRLSMVSSLAASVAHEIRTPLTVVKGFSQLLGTEQTKSNKEFVPIILHELDRTEEIVQNFLNLAYNKVSEMKSISSIELIDSSIEALTTYSSNSKVPIDCFHEKNYRLKGDFAPLCEALINILKNSIDAVSNPHGKVTVKCFMKNKNVIIQVKDNGVGMTSEQIERLGEPAYNLIEKGTSLGLMTAFSIIYAHGGDIQFKSKINKGTVVTISIPGYKKGA
ncbi:ATP-binding protein [Sutcliffiella cohnii]